MYMANVRGPNLTSIPPARIGAPVEHRLMLGTISLCWALLAHVGPAKLFRYQHVGIPNAKSSCLGCKPTREPNASGFTLQWNIGFTVVCVHMYLMHAQ